MDAELKNYLNNKFEGLVTKEDLKQALKPYITRKDLKQELGTLATKDDLSVVSDSLKGEIKILGKEIRYEIEVMEGRLNTTINQLGKVVNEAVAVPLRLIDERVQNLEKQRYS